MIKVNLPEKVGASLIVVGIIIIVILHAVHVSFVQHQAFLHGASVVLAMMMVLWSWKLIVQTSDGWNILRNYFILVFFSNLWLLGLDMLSMLGDVTDFIPRVIRVVVYRGLLVLGTLWLSARITALLSAERIRRQRAEHDI